MPPACLPAHSQNACLSPAKTMRVGRRKAVCVQGAGSKKVREGGREERQRGERKAWHTQACRRRVHRLGEVFTYSKQKACLPGRHACPQVKGALTRHTSPHTTTAIASSKGLGQGQGSSTATTRHTQPCLFPSFSFPPVGRDKAGEFPHVCQVCKCPCLSCPKLPAGKAVQCFCLEACLPVPHPVPPSSSHR